MSSIGQDHSDPVHFNREDNRWYFWDETWSFAIGPYDTEDEARLALDKYAENL